MSWFSTHVFDPIKAAIARAQTSSSPVAQAVGAAAAAGVANVTATVRTDLPVALTSGSAAALQNDAIAGLEAGLTDVVDAFITASLGAAGPVGAAFAPETVSIANMGLTFAEQHALTFLSSLFSHGKAQVASAVAPPTPKSPAYTPPGQ